MKGEITSGIAASKEASSENIAPSSFSGVIFDKYDLTVMAGVVDINPIKVAKGRKIISLFDVFGNKIDISYSTYPSTFPMKS